MNLYKTINTTPTLHATSIPYVETNKISTKFLLTCDNYSELFSELSDHYESVNEYDSLKSTIKTIYLNHGNCLHKNETIQFQNVDIDSTELDLNNSFAVKFNRVQFNYDNEEDFINVDYNIVYKSGHKEFSLNNIVIIELYSLYPHKSAVMQKLLQNGITPMKFTKYDIGKAFCTQLAYKEKETTKPTKLLTRINREPWRKIVL